MLKKICLISGFIIIFLGGLHAQVNTGANPYLNSTHTYRVNGGAVTESNTYSWNLYDGETLLTAGTDYSISGGNTPEATIVWDKNIVTKDYILRLVESDGVCQSIREMTITVMGNNLDASVADLGGGCPDPSVNALATTVADPGTSVRTFTLVMGTGDPSWTPAWRFDYAITNLGSATISNLLIGGVDRTGSLTGNDIVVAQGTTSIDIQITIDNVLNETQDISVVVSDVVETDKNTPEPSANIGDDNTGTVTIDPMPATTDITTD